MMIEECLVVEFRVTGDGCPLAEAAASAGVTVDASPPLLRSDGYALLFFSALASDALASVLDADDRIRYLHASRADDRVNFRCLSKEPCVVHRLIDAGFLVESVHYRDGAEHHVGAVVGHDVLDGVLQAAGEAVGVSLQRVSPLGDEGEAAVAARWDLTPAQEEAVRAAYEMGYFSVPRTTTAEEVADELGVSKSAFLERLRRAQSGLLEQVLTETG